MGEYFTAPTPLIAAPGGITYPPISMWANGPLTACPGGFIAMPLSRCVSAQPESQLIDRRDCECSDRLTSHIFSICWQGTDSRMLLVAQIYAARAVNRCRDSCRIRRMSPSLQHYNSLTHISGLVTIVSRYAFSQAFYTPF